MTFTYTELNTEEKKLKFINGLYPVENNDKLRWIWTSKRVFGTSSNIKSLIIHLNSEIENTLYFEEMSTKIENDTLNVIKIDLTNKSDFNIEVDKLLKPKNDERELGFKIVRIIIDNEIVF